MMETARIETHAAAVAETQAAQTQSAAQAAMMAVTAESAKMTAEAAKELVVIERKTATEAEARANATGTAGREAQIATGTVGSERTAAQTTFDYHMMYTARIVTYEAAVVETQAAQTQAVIAMTQTQAEYVWQTQVSIDKTEIAGAIQMAAEGTRIAIQARTASALATEQKKIENTETQATIWTTYPAIGNETQIVAKATQTAAQAQIATQAAKYRVGDIIQFGRYEQDNDLSNGAEDIEWRILAIEGDTALVVSVMGLDAKPYDEGYHAIMWKDCTLREWLNNDFYNTAFDDGERAKIELTYVVKDNKPNYSIKAGNDTEDYILLLNIEEVEMYFSNSEDRIMKLTKYAISSGAEENWSNGNGWWWLRSPGTSGIAALVTSAGIIDYTRIYEWKSVRPAMWINLEKW